jgi:hypothetical protein
MTKYFLYRCIEFSHDRHARARVGTTMVDNSIEKLIHFFQGEVPMQRILSVVFPLTSPYHNFENSLFSACTASIAPILYLRVAHSASQIKRASSHHEGHLTR